MKINFAKIETPILEVIQNIGHLADEMGVAAYVVGGFVRDVILRRPNLDVDILVEGDAMRLAERLSQVTSASLTVFKQFGTATLNFENGLRVDLGSTRKESYPRPGSLPVVERGNIHEDLFRRDFSINAMAAGINAGRWGELVDLFGGLDDLRAKRVRVLHEKSFVDDPTRILRAVRFEQRFNFKLERSTLQWLKAAIKKNVVRTVAPPRYFAEFRKILKETDPSKAMARLAQLKGLDFISREYKPDQLLLKKIVQSVQLCSKDPFYSNKNWSAVYLLALFAKQRIKDVVEFSARFHMTKEERENLLVVQDMSWSNILKHKVLAPSRVYQILKPLSREVVYFLLAISRGSSAGEYCDSFLKKWAFVKTNISGDDIKKMGVASGKEVGEILEKVLFKRLDGLLLTRRDELQEAQRLLGGTHYGTH